MADIGICMVIVGILGIIGTFKTLKNKWWMAWYFFFNLILFIWYVSFNIDTWNRPEIAMAWIPMIINGFAAVFLWIFVNKGIDDVDDK